MNIRFAARSMNKTIPRTIVATLNFFLLGFIFGFVSALTRDPQHQILSALYVGANAGGFLALCALVFLPIDVYKFWRLTNRGRTAINTSSNNQPSKTSVRPPFFSLEKSARKQSTRWKEEKAPPQFFLGNLSPMSIRLPLFLLTGLAWFFVSGVFIVHRVEIVAWSAAALFYVPGITWTYQFLFRRPMSMVINEDLLPTAKNRVLRAALFVLGLACIHTVSFY